MAEKPSVPNERTIFSESLMGKSETEGDLRCSHDPNSDRFFSPIEQGNSNANDGAGR
jgi:hypothetical protein